MNWSWIPQLHYDFIGRVVPGLALIGASLLVAAGPETGVRLLTDAGGRYFGFGPIAVGILAAYLVGLILCELWNRTFGAVLQDHERAVEEDCYSKCLKDHGGLCQHCERSFTLHQDNLPRAYVLRTHLRHVAAEDVLRLLKLRAERRLCQVLMLGLIGLTIADVFLLVRTFEVGRLTLAITFPLVSVLLWFRSERLLRHFVTGICIAWLVHFSLRSLPFAEKDAKSAAA